MSTQATRRALFAGLSTLPLADRAWAEAPWPNRPVRLVVTFLPGGILDTLARLIAPPLQRRLGQPFVVENRPGAGGNVGTALAARAKGDSYTLLVGSSGPLAISPSIESNLGYSPLTDFTPITLLASTPLVLVVPANSPWHSLRDMIAAVKSSQGEFLYPTPGIGSPQLLAGEALRQRVGFRATPVSYNGSAPAVLAIIAGEMPYTFENLVLVAPHLAKGTLRALAVTSAQRSHMLPEVPTMEEAGLPGFQAGGWYGLLAPAGVSQEVVDRLHAATVAVLHEPDVAPRILEMGSLNISSTPDQFREHIRQETERWRHVMLAANAPLDREPANRQSTGR
ncbi:tripartite tricarboxylate transporter substrate binding protein [Belnapia sp. T6]|uniref:Tripartite tricarboxylate transporter substrate binding protein n=1 Tax=Belnapia mucosa TaxID=2804532 RepID=A0ABS1VBQ5_9PROT|nr:tripartite tricarboxylate transporter substrate binding protein [Belnapia mucosa]MBL6459050.1 tripartite tricarboxylate transporter substrate binding protein [Belnapia mucosa]